MPLGRRYMDIDTGLAKRSFDVEKEDTCHKVYLEGVLLAGSGRAGKAHVQLQPPKRRRAPCTHTLAVDETEAFSREEWTQ